jgi:hypothetical protein
MMRSTVGTWAQGVFALVCVACGGPVLAPDGGADASTDGSGAPASVAVHVLADDSSLGDGMTLSELSIAVVTVRVPNDRATLARDFDRSFDVTTTIAELMLEGAEPAVYGSAELDLDSGAWGPALVLRIASPDETLEVQIDEPITLEARCATPIALAAGGRLVFDVEIHVAGLAEALRDPPLPAPVDGVVHVSRSSAPAAIDAVLSALAGEAHLDCDELEGTH